MKFHGSLVERLISIVSTHGGYNDQSRLRQKLAELDVATYKRQSGEEVLVDADDLEKALNTKR